MEEEGKEEDGKEADGKEEERVRKDLNPDYELEHLRPRFVADAKGTINAFPLCQRPGCSKCDSSSLPSGRRRNYPQEGGGRRPIRYCPG